MMMMMMMMMIFPEILTENAPSVVNKLYFVWWDILL